MKNAMKEQIATLQEMYDGASDTTKDEIVNKVIELAATEEPATVEETATVEKTAAEKFLEAKKEIRLSHGRYLGNDRFADQWQRHNGFRWVNISKKAAAFELKFHGLTIDEFLTEQKNYVDNEVAKSLAQMAIDNQADFTSDKIRRESKVDDEDVFSLLPALDELNDVEDDLDDTSDALNKVTVFDEIGNEITTIVIGNEYMRLYNGELWGIRSLKYCARWSNIADQIGWYVSNGKNPWRNIIDEEEFFAEMERRGACTVEPNEPADDFTAELAKLQAQVESARAEAEDARDAFRAAQKVCNDAEQNCIAADNKAYEAEAAVEKFIRAKANALTKIIDNAPDIITAPRMAVTLQGGEVKRMKFDNLAVNYLNGKFLFDCDCDCDWQTLAEYDTPAQVETVIGELRAAIAHGSKKFIFPTFGTQVGGIFKELDAIKATA